MSRLPPILAALLGFALGCADRLPDCDPDTQMRVTYGTDLTTEDETVACETLPDECGAEPSCDCLEGLRLENGLNLDFCLEEGTCEVDDDGLIELMCPGG